MALPAAPARAAIRPQSLASQVQAEVLRRIASGELAPGATLNIAELARQTGVSQTPVREALARLSAEGQLVFVHNIGYRLPQAPSARQYADWAVARVAVETQALLYILGPIDSRLVDEAEAINEQIRAADFGTGATGARRFGELNWRFHARLLALARNDLLTDIHARLYAAPQFSRIFLGRGILHQAEVVAEHARVIAALRRGDRRAAADALREHIVDSLDRDARLAHVSVSLRRILRGQPPLGATPPTGDALDHRSAPPKPPGPARRRSAAARPAARSAPGPSSPRHPLKKKETR